MKAAVCLGYGAPEKISVMDVPTPKIGKKDVLIKVMASSVNSGDVRVRGLIADPITRTALRMVLGVTKPRKPILGVALAGEVVSVGSDVSLFKVGDRVYAMTGMRFGGHGQYASLSEKSCMALKPQSASYEEAAVLPFGGTTAIHFLNKAGIKSGHDVMIYGASGAVGSSAVQVAKYLGATVTAVCSGRHAEKMVEIGAADVIDYKTDQFKAHTKQYDIIFDAVGKIKKGDVEKMLKSGGNFISVAGYGVASERKAFLNLLNQMYEEGQLKAVIDRTFALEDIVAAHTYVDLGVKTGNVAITINHD
ncbi:MAG TPA: NAD(P)-dependent alcohol dehydrogenase [Clostridiales bacterium UBA8960]|nr:NAD(P)-dependent alcohol dehydrogenase [Clostridiales bacterium UBA8960]